MSGVVKSGQVSVVGPIQFNTGDTVWATLAD